MKENFAIISSRSLARGLWRHALVVPLILLGVASPAHGASSGAEASLRKRVRIKKESRVLFQPEMKSEELTLEKMELLERKRNALLFDIKRFIREARDGAQKSELNFRLASLYMEDYYAKLNKAQSLYAKELEAYDALPKKAKSRRSAPKLDSAEANASLKRARTLYKDLLKQPRVADRRDEILYFLAASALDTGSIGEGMKFFQQLIELHPNSKYVNEALVQLGDYYFEENAWGRAEGYYDKLLAKKYKPLLSYSVYKKAWCAYNLQRPKESLAGLKWVVEHEDGDGSDLKIRNEALVDIALPFVELRLLDESITFFSKQEDPYRRKGFEAMAGLYADRNERQASIRLYDILLKLDPNHPKNPDYDLNIVESYRVMEKGEKSATERLYLRLPAYLKNSSWYEINATKPEVVQGAASAFEELARKMAFEFHARAQKMHSKEHYDLARDLYAKYLEHFDTSPDADRIRFFLAEILFKQEQYVAAATEYYRVYKSPNAGKLKLDAIRFSLSALDRQLNIDRKKAGLGEVSSKSSTLLKAKADESLELIPYSTVETTFLKISKEYLTHFGSSKDAADVLFEQSYLQYVHHDFNDAYTGFWSFMKEHESHAASYRAAHLILDILNRKKSYGKLAAAAKKFLRTKSLSQAKFRAEISDILRHSELKRIQIAEERGEFRKAAFAYVEYTKEYGPQDMALYEKALFNASVNFTKASLHLHAVETQEKFLRQFPKSPLRENTMLGVAKQYELLANFAKAAEYFEQFTNLYPRNAQSKNTLRLAGLYSWAATRPDKADALMRRYIASFPSDPDRAAVERDLANVYELQGNVPKLVKFLDEKRNRRGVSYGEYVSLSVRIAELLAPTNQNQAVQVADEALRMAESHAKALSESDNGKEALAKLLFWRTANRERAFYQIALKPPQATLQANLKRKLGLLKALEDEYLRVVSAGSGEWGIGATYKIARAYRHMADAVLQAPVPEGLKAEELEQYREEISKSIVAPFNEKALAFAMRCLDKAQDLNVLSPWTAGCHAVAGQLDPKRYPRVRTFYLPPLQTALLLPKNGESKISRGNLRTYAFPVFSSALFSAATVDRFVASGLELPLLRTASEENSTTPAATTYEVLSDMRQKAILDDLKSEKPSDKDTPSFAYLNLKRLASPKEALKLIHEAIERDPEDSSLHNLLALTYLEQGDIAAAKVTWLALTARGKKSAELWNNLGVALALEGKEREAIDYFHEATLMEEPREALTNLGFIALKYYNGFEAKKHFQRAIDMGRKDPSTKVGLSVARVQNREIESAMEILPELSKRYRSDPYARLSLAYLLLDAANEKEVATHVLTDYIESHSAENDPQFRRALNEARAGMGAGGDISPRFESGGKEEIEMERGTED